MPARPKKTEAKPKPAGAAGALLLIFGDDDYRVEHAARRTIAEFFPDGPPEMGVEVVDGRAANQSEGLKSLDRLFESLNTFSFFSSRKVVWWKNTNLLGDKVAAAVSERIGELVEMLKEQGVPAETLLLITADAADARKSFYKHADKSGKIISFKEERGRDSSAEAYEFAEGQLKELGVTAEPRALSSLVERTDSAFRAIKSELEKLAAYAGKGGQIREADVALLASGRPDADVWKLTGAIDKRDIEEALQRLDQLRYQGEEPMGLLFALISHVRGLLFLRELIDLGALRPATHPGQVQGQLERIPAAIKAQLPKDKKWNPLLGNPYAIYHRLSGAAQYSASELRRAMRILAECNEKLVSTGVEFDWLENAVLKILTGESNDVSSGRKSVG